MRTMKKRILVSDDAVLWIGTGLVLAAAIIFDRQGMPQRWHAAIMWTAVAFGPPTVVRRKRWNSWPFWLCWIIYLSVHLALMWVLFAYLLTKVRVLGTLYVVPFAAIEALVLLVLLSKRQVRRPPSESKVTT